LSVWWTSVRTPICKDMPQFEPRGHLRVIQQSQMLRDGDNDSYHHYCHHHHHYQREVSAAV